jgi:hypothetical protein
MLPVRYTLDDMFALALTLAHELADYQCILVGGAVVAYLLGHTLAAR